jgi:hypothetical protein
VAGSSIPEEVQQFLAAHTPSIERLEILLLLSGSPGRRWTQHEVYQTVLSNEKSVEEALDQLCQQGLLAVHGGGPHATYQFSPPERLKTVIAELARLYKERRVKVVESIYAPPVSEIDEFAKAFRIRKDK